MKTTLILAIAVLLPVLLIISDIGGFKQRIGDAALAYMTQTGLLLWDTPPEATMEAVQKELKRIGDDIKSQGEKAIAEAKKAGDMTIETKTKVDELLVKQGELQARLQEAEQKLDKSSNAGNEEQQESIGQQFIKSDLFKDYQAKGDPRNNSVSFGVKAITSLAASAGDGVEPQRIPGVIGLAERRLTIRDLITPGTTGSNSIQYLKETGFTNNAAPQAETVKKGESDITFDLMNSPVSTLAHFVKASKQILDDFAQLQSYIDGRLYYGLKLVEDTQLLKGSGAGNNLNGIYTQATAYAAPIVITGATRIDVLRLALLQAELAEFPSTGIVLHPSDWAAIELTKDSTGAYVFANPQSLAAPGLWGRPVVTTQAMTIDTFLVGAFQLGAQVFDREQANIVIATQNEDDFVKNMITIRAEERLALAVYRPEAFIKGDITPA